jgi:hypothetical protein
MVTPDSQNAEPTCKIEGVPVFWYCQSTTDEIDDENWVVLLTTLNYYKEYDIIDPVEAWAYYSVLFDPEYEGIRISQYLVDFWEEAVGMYTWIERDYIDYQSDGHDLGMYIDRDNQFWIVGPCEIRNFADEILDAIIKEWGDPCEDDVANLLWALGELSMIDPNYCVNEIAKLHLHWTDCDCLVRFDEMISDFFARPHITWPDWI